MAPERSHAAICARTSSTGWPVIVASVSGVRVASRSRSSRICRTANDPRRRRRRAVRPPRRGWPRRPRRSSTGPRGSGRRARRTPSPARTHARGERPGSSSVVSRTPQPGNSSQQNIPPVGVVHVTAGSRSATAAVKARAEPPSPRGCGVRCASSQPVSASSSAAIAWVSEEPQRSVPCFRRSTAPTTTGGPVSHPTRSAGATILDALPRRSTRSLWAATGRAGVPSNASRPYGSSSTTRKP